MIKIGKIIGNKVRRFFVSEEHRYINGSKGVISIFLACMLVPFAYIADLLVESGRYNSSMAIVEQSLTNAELSTLSDYDEYLLERFGLMAVSQEQDLNALFSEYHEKAAKDISQSLEISEVAAEGLMALTNNEVLTRQIAEAGKYSIPAYFAGTTLSELISKIEGLTKLDGIMEMLTDAGNMTDAYVTFADELTKLKTSASTLETKQESYDTAYDNFKSDVNKLVDGYIELDGAKSTLSEAKTQQGRASETLRINKEFAYSYRDLITSYYQILATNDAKRKPVFDVLEAVNTFISYPTTDNWNTVTEYADSTVSSVKVRDFTFTVTNGSTVTTYSINSLLNSISSVGLIGYQNTLNSKNTAVSNAEKEVSRIEGELSPLKENANTEKGNYKTAITNAKTALTDYQSQLKKVVEAKKKVMETGTDIAKKSAEEMIKDDDPDLTSWGKEKEELDEKIKTETDPAKKTEYESQLKDVETKISGREAEYDNAKKAAENMESVAKETFDKSHTKSFFDQTDNFDSLVSTAVSELDKVYTNVNNFNAYAKVTTKLANRPTNHAYYYNIKDSFSTSAVIQSVITEFENSITDDGSSDKGIFAQLKAIFGCFESMISAGGIYHSELNSFVQSTGDFTESAIDGVLGSMAKFMNAVFDLKDLNFTNIFTKIKNVITSALDFFEALITYVGETVDRIVKSVTELVTGKIGDRLLLSQYITMALPDRTTFESGSSAITGMSYSDIARDDTGSLGIPGLSTIQDIVDIFKGYTSETGNDPVFSGAEIEYILMGSKSEVVNQAGTFFQIYFIRLLFDVIPIMTNSFVQSLASSAGSATFGIGTVIVYAAYILAEPFIDTTLIAGGNAMPLIKYTNDVYLTPTGLPNLLKDLTGFAMSEAAKKKLKDEGKKLTGEGKEIKKADGEPKKVDASKKKSLDINIDVGYTTYCFMLILFSNDTGTTLNRLRNLISLEANAYYATKGQTFELAKTYTYIKGTAKAEFSPILPLEPMSATAFKEINSTQYRGY